MRLSKRLSEQVVPKFLNLKARYRLNGLLRGAPTGASPHELFSAVDDRFWFWINTEGQRRVSKVRRVLPELPDETTQRNFTGAAGDVTLREAFDFYTVVKQYANQYGKPLTSCQQVLDFGCGWGRITRFFIKDLEGDQLRGIDCYPAVLEVAQRTNRWCPFELVDPLPPTKLASGSVDIIYSFSVFSHLSEAAHEQWLEEFQRLLKPGGLLFATTRARDFIVKCAHLREAKRTGRIEPFLNGPAGAFVDTQQSLADYDSGKFCYSGVGGGGVLDRSFYGEAAIPEGYVKEQWSTRFQPLEYIADKGVCEQNIIIVRKP